ncbi:M23 family metallopeptidase [Candidatus Uhrbacteria bacterium]|nr:M23 family metallopeptidase [Candidatus Uhrbacteria bacterium]
MYFLTNRYAIHVFVACVVFGTGVMSVQASGLRAEDFGQKSILYNLVSDQANVTTVVRSDVPVSKPLRYLSASALSVQPDIDFHDPMDDYVSTTAGGAAIIAPTISEVGKSVAPRTDVLEYEVQIGDTLGTIAQAHGISINTLLWSNSLSTRSVIRPGNKLKILPVNGIQHTVKSGDTLIKIASKYDSDTDKIIQYNSLANASDLSIGETLLIPDGKIIASAPRRTTSVARVFSAPAKTVAAPAAAATGSGAMIWPTDLSVITQYFGWRHTGVDIDCHFTNQNYAADDGYVQLAGWKGGYGLTVEINHGNGIVTRYGHHASLAVKAGQQITQGTPLGVCGTTGNSTGTHLHFEVIRNGKFMNPLEYVR